MDASEFPDEFNLRFRNHVLFVHLKSTLEFAEAIATQSPESLTYAELKLFDDLADQLEKAWVDAVRLKTQAYAKA